MWTPRRRELVALVALLDLATHAGSADWVKTPDIAERWNVPLPFLEQVVSRLQRAKLIRSRRGRQGGLRLAREAAHIRVGDALRAIAPSTRRAVAPPSSLEAIALDACDEADRALQDVLDARTLGDLVARAERAGLVPLQPSPRAGLTFEI